MSAADLCPAELVRYDHVIRLTQYRCHAGTPPHADIDEFIAAWRELNRGHPKQRNRPPATPITTGAERIEMTSFTDDEIAYMNSQPLARIATVSADGQPDVVPVGFEFDGTHINIGGHDPATTRRHHNILAGNGKVALVIDDLVSTRPWTPRYLRIYGTADVIEGTQPYLRMTPKISWSWNLGAQPFTHDESFTPPKRTVHH